MQRKDAVLMPITLHTDVTPDAIPEQTEEVLGHFRDEFQLTIDKDVAALKRATAKAGWPVHNPKTLFHRYVVDAKESAALKAVIRRAATFEKVTASFYKDAATAAGHAVVKFHTDRKVGSDGKFVKDDTLNADGSLKIVVKPSVK
jgi:hypothetical protein